MAARWLQLFTQQHAAGFPDVAGAQFFATVPISDRLLTRIINDTLPQSAPVREVDVRAHDANTLSVRIRLSRPALLPPITLRLQIEGQPDLPANPVIGLRVLSAGSLVALAGRVMRFVDVLPPGIQIDGDLMKVNLATLLRERGAGEILSYLQQLEIGTDEGRLIVMMRGGVPQANVYMGSAGL